MIEIWINGELLQREESCSDSILTVLRRDLGLDGAKLGCDHVHCGHCLVLLDGVPVRSCSLQVADLSSCHIVTIEGLAPDESHPLRQAWSEERVANCGHCQSAQMVAAAHLLARNRSPRRRDILQAQKWVICRCGTYPRIVHAILRAAALAQAGDSCKQDDPASPMS